MDRRRRRRVEPTDDWEQLQLLCRWPEQVAYEEIRPLVLFGDSVAERARATGSAERTLYRKASRFETEGMDSLFATERARRLVLPPVMRRFIVDLKAFETLRPSPRFPAVPTPGFGTGTVPGEFWQSS